MTSPVEPTTPLDDTAIADEPEAPPVATTSVADTDGVAVPVSAADTGDDEPADNAVARADVIGTWKLEYQGQRVVTMRDDGSAVMRVSLDFFGALLYGESLTLELEWTLEDGILTHRVIRGEPKQNVAKLIRDFGDAVRTALSPAETNWSSKRSIPPTTSTAGPPCPTRQRTRLSARQLRQDRRQWASSSERSCSTASACMASSKTLRRISSASTVARG